MSSPGFFDPSESLYVRRGGSLPHWRQEGVTYFVTFRLADSIPQKKIREWETTLAYARQLRAAGDPRWEDLELRLSRQIETWLDRGWGSSVLRFPEANALVDASLRHFDGERYDLYESKVAANHVHAILKVANGEVLSRITYSWKHGRNTMEASRGPESNEPILGKPLAARIVRSHCPKSEPTGKIRSVHQESSGPQSSGAFRCAVLRGVKGSGGLGRWPWPHNA